MFESHNSADAIRSLNDAELDAITGGIIIVGGCIATQTISMGTVPPDWSFNSVFTRYVIGRNLPVPA